MTSAKVVKKKRYPVRPRLRCDPNPYAGLRYAIGTIRNWNHSGYWGILRTNRTAQFSLISRPSTAGRRTDITLEKADGMRAYRASHSQTCIRERALIQA